jgi:hypothetical protein
VTRFEAEKAAMEANAKAKRGESHYAYRQSFNNWIVKSNLSCRQRREGDEIVCRCGKRWPFGEPHP